MVAHMDFAKHLTQTRQIPLECVNIVPVLNEVDELADVVPDVATAVKHV